MNKINKNHEIKKLWVLFSVLGALAFIGSPLMAQKKGQDESKGMGMAQSHMDHSKMGKAEKDHSGMMDHADMKHSSDHDMSGNGTAHGVWKNINAANTHLKELVQTGKFDEVHEAEERLSRHLGQLAAVSTDLSESKQKRVKGTLKNIDKLLDGLHDAADEGKANAVESKMKSLDGLFNVLAAQYPPEITADSAEMDAAGHDEMDHEAPSQESSSHGGHQH